MSYANLHQLEVIYFEKPRPYCKATRRAKGVEDEKHKQTKSRVIFPHTVGAYTLVVR